MTSRDFMAEEPAISLSIPGREGPELAAALREEAALMQALIDLLERQRQGIAAGDSSLVEETVHGSQRILLTLVEARKRRARIVEILTDGTEPDGGSESIVDDLGPAASAAWALLNDVAERLSTALEINQGVLKEAIRFGEEYVRTVFVGQPPDGGSYTSEALPSAPAAGGALINRTV